MSRKLGVRARGLWMIAFAALSIVRAQGQRPLGTDVSGYQPGINWTTVKNAGVSFAWAKASQGTAYTYPSTFPAQAAGAKAQGIYFGAYHYATPSLNPNITGASSADSEADFFWRQAGAYIKNGGGYLMPMLDWEDTGVTTSKFTAAALTAWANEWCHAIVRYGVTNGVTLRPVIYTGTWYSEPSSTYPGLTTAITNWPDWIASYPANANAQTGSPGATFPWASWNLWQYGDTNWSGGDADVYNGTLAKFIQSFVIGGTNAPTLGNPTNITVAQGGDATFSAQATGGNPLGFQWYFNGIAIPGATSASYRVANAQLANAGGFVVVVTNSYASVTSSPAFLSVIATPTNAPGSVVAPPGMVNWWPAEGNCQDLFGTNNATPVGGLTYVAGEVGLGWHFDGSTSYLLVNGGTSNAPNWTACMWVNRQASSAASAALLGDQLYSLKLEQYNGTHEVGITKAGVADYLFTPPYTAPAGVWTHLAFVGTSSAVFLYTNGILEGSVAVSGFMLPRACLGANLISNGATTDIMAGGLDEVQTYNVALTAAQIQSIYEAGGAGLVGAPQFAGVTASAAGQVQLNLQGLTGKTFTIQTSSDLVNWTNLTTVANPTGTLPYQDSSAAPPVFYRLSQP